MNNFFVRIETLGCRLNQTESEALAALFFEAGFPVFSHPLKSSDKKNGVGLCIVNTCTVTGKAEQKARRLIRLLLKEHENAIVLVTGCYAELEAEEIEKIDGRVTAFSGKKKDNLSELPLYIKEHLNCAEACLENENKPSAVMPYAPPEFSCRDKTNLKKILLSFKEKYGQNSDVRTLQNISEDKSKIFKLSSTLFLFHSRAALKIQDGCSNACAFCRIRLARGKSVSLPAKEALLRLQKLEQAGVKEAVISGVNLSQYSDGGYNFARLLAFFLENTSSVKLRISSLYPETITEEILPVLENKRICPHFHLSVQSGSDIILEKMRRRYRRTDIYNAVNLIRTVKKKPFLGCDIITGFPGETDECFEQTFSMCSGLEFAGIHSFPFSARPGTEAYKMSPKIPERVAGERTAALNLLAEKNYRRYLAICEGEIFSAITEKPIPKEPLKIVTENYLSLELSDGAKNLTGNAPRFSPFLFAKHPLPAVFSGGEEIKVKILDGKAVLIQE